MGSLAARAEEQEALQFHRGIIAAQLRDSEDSIRLKTAEQPVILKHQHRPAGFHGVGSEFQIAAVNDPAVVGCSLSPVKEVLAEGLLNFLPVLPVLLLSEPEFFGFGKWRRRRFRWRFRLRVTAGNQSDADGSWSD